MLINVLRNLFGDSGSLQQGQVEITPAIEKSDFTGKKVLIPEKFKGDIEALNRYISPDTIDGKKHIEINVSLSEILSIIPRERKRSDAYSPLVRFLGDELNTTLTITKKFKKKQ